MADLPVIECYLGDTTDILELGVQTSKKNVPPITVATLDANYSCKIAVDGAAPPINRAVTLKTADNLYFRGWLTPAETQAIGVGDHILGMQISNATVSPPLVKEKQWTLRILPSAVSG